MNIHAYFKHWTEVRQFQKIIPLQEAQLRELIKERANKEIPFELFEVTKFLLEENIDLYKSIAILLRNGRFQSCLVLGRVIIENSINLIYIYQKDSEQRAKNYMVHSFVTTFERMRKAGIDEFPDGAKIVEQIVELRKKFHKSGSRDFYWDGKSFREICAAVKHETVYDDWYARLSKFTHSQYKGQRDLDEHRPYNDFLKRLIWRDMLVPTLEGLKAINEKYDLLEGVMVIGEYPHEGATFFFSISSKRTEEDAMKQVEAEWEKKKR